MRLYLEDIKDGENKLKIYEILYTNRNEEEITHFRVGNNNVKNDIIEMI